MGNMGSSYCLHRIHRSRYPTFNPFFFPSISMFSLSWNSFSYTKYNIKQVLGKGL